MAGQHVENLFRRLKGEIVSIKTISGRVYKGRIVEVTNDFVCLSETIDFEGAQVFLFFQSIETLIVTSGD